MKSIGQIIPSVLTQIAERTTKEQRIFTEMQLSKVNAFQTFNDRQLERMRDEAVIFINEMSTEPEPTVGRWLSFVGKSGTGKTHLAKIILNSVPVSFYQHRSLLNPVMREDWPELISYLREGKFWKHEDLRDAKLLLLDDIGASRDTEFAIEQLHRILNNRRDKWTVVTANLSLEEIANRLDTRISSRLIRDGNVCVEVTTTDFALRPNTTRSPVPEKARPRQSSIIDPAPKDYQPDTSQPFNTTQRGGYDEHKEKRIEGTYR